MKKLLSIFLLMFILVSCVNNEDEFKTDQSEIKDAVLYNVPLKVSGFKYSEIPLLKKYDISALCRYIVYKESGDVYLDQEISNFTLQESGTPDLTLSLPIGKYKIAFMIIGIPEYDKGAPTFKISNFHIDACEGRYWNGTPKDDSGIFFKVVDISVTGSQSNPISVELEPMVSQLNVTVSDYAVCTLPEGTEYVSLVATPHNYGFYFKDKSPFNKYESTPIFLARSQTVADFRNREPLPSINIGASKDVVVSLVFWNFTNDKAVNVLGKKQIFKGTIDAGKIVNFLGNIGVEKGSPVFDFSFKPMIDEHLPFQ